MTRRMTRTGQAVFPLKTLFFGLPQAGDLESEGPATVAGNAPEGPASGLDLVRKLCEGSGGQLRVIASGRGDGVTIWLEFRRKQPRAMR